MKDLKTITLKNLFKKGLITTISQLRVNQNGYPFVTLLCNKKALNVYFAKDTSEIVLSTFEKGDNILSFVATLEVAQTENNDGETRFKLFIPKSHYASKTELMSVFGIDEITNFDTELFQKSFTAKEEVAVN